MSGFELRGNEQDDPDLYPVMLPRGSTTLMKTEDIDTQTLESTSIISASEGSVRLSKERYVQLSNTENIFYPRCLLEIPKVSIGALPGSSVSAKCSSKADSCH